MGSTGRLVELQRLVATLHDADLVACSQRDLSGLASSSLRLQSWLASIDARIAAEADARCATGTGVTDGSRTLAGDGRRSTRDAATAAERGRACTLLPELGAALADGTVSAAHVDGLAAATRHLDDTARSRFGAHADELAAAARSKTPEEFGRQCRDVAARAQSDGGVGRQERLRKARTICRWTDPDGMCHTKLSLDPLADARIWSVFSGAFGSARASNQQGDDRTFEQLRADTVVELITRTAIDGNAGGRDLGTVGAEVVVLIDVDTLRGPAADDARVAETADGQGLPAETIRRLACDNGLLPVFLRNGRPLDVGRRTRLATRRQRHALRALYATCAHPGCRVGFEQCRIHHVIWWRNGGRTDLDNLLPLCETHHHLVHEGGCELTLYPDRNTRWHHLDGEVIRHHGPNRLASRSRPNALRAPVGPSRRRNDYPMGLFDQAGPGDDERAPPAAG